MGQPTMDSFHDGRYSPPPSVVIEKPLWPPNYISKTSGDSQHLRSISASHLTSENLNVQGVLSLSPGISNLNETSLNFNLFNARSTSHDSSDSSQFSRKAFSLPHHYKPPSLLGSWRFRSSTLNEPNAHLQANNALTTNNAGVPPLQFRQQFSRMKEWFNGFNDEQRNRVFVELLEHIGPSQLHILSVAIGDRLHEGCPPNCMDPITCLPPNLPIAIFSYLDPVSLARAAQVSKTWYKLSCEDYLWRKLSSHERWMLSRSGHEKQIRKCLREDGSVDWKQVFTERFRLRRNWKTAQCHIRTFEGHKEGVSCVQFDENRIVSGSHDNTIKVWNIRTNSQLSVLPLMGHHSFVRCIHLAGNIIVSGSADKTIKVWEVEETAKWSSILCRVTMVGHQDIVRCLQVKDDLVVSGSYDCTLRAWSLNTGECLKIMEGHTGHVLTVAFDKNKVVSGSADHSIKIWQLDSGQCLNTLTGHKDAVSTLTFDETRIISGSLDCTIRLWCLSTGQCVNVLDWMSSEGHTGVIRCLAADEFRIVSASDDKTIKVWDRQTGKRMVTLRNHTDGVTCLAFNDHIIVSGSYDKSVKLWDFSVC